MKDGIKKFFNHPAGATISAFAICGAFVTALDYGISNTPDGIRDTALTEVFEQQLEGNSAVKYLQLNGWGTTSELMQKAESYPACVTQNTNNNLTPRRQQNLIAECVKNS